MSQVAKFFAKTAISAARSLLLSEVKGGVKSILDKKRSKTVQDIEQEMSKSIGYTSVHCSINQKTQALTYKSSPIFVHEWLTNSPLVREKIVRDEESGHVYIDGEIITNNKKLNLIGRFIESTGIKIASVSSHFEGALKLLDGSDVTADKFRAQFGGWNPEQPSVINSWIYNCFGNTLSTEQDYASFLFRKWIIGTTKRIVNPGCAFDGCLTFTGGAGIGKSSFFRQLMAPPFEARTGEILCNIKNPVRLVESIIGKSIVNFDELSQLNAPRTEETFKQLLTSSWVDVRLAWKRDPQRFKLRNSFAATTNEAKFINEPAMLRRLWVIALNGEKGRLNFDYLANNKIALWREALWLVDKGENIHLSVEEQHKVEAHNAQYLRNN